MMARATWEIARKEFLQLLRTKRLLVIGLILIATMVLLTIVVPVSLFDLEGLEEDAAADAGEEFSLHNVILLFFLGGVFILSGYFIIQLLPIVLTSDAVCSEWQNRTIFLVLSKPVPRAAFVLGKFLGITLPLALFTVLLLLLDYLLMVGFIPGTPSAEAWARFFGGMGILTLGVMAFGALALFFSTLFRSSVASMLTTVVAWIIVLPLLGQIQFFIDIANDDPDAFETDEARWSEFLNPGGLMRATDGVLEPSHLGGFLGNFTGGSDAMTWWMACLGLVGHTFVWLLGSVMVVQGRNFE